MELLQLKSILFINCHKIVKNYDPVYLERSTRDMLERIAKTEVKTRRRAVGVSLKEE